MTKLKYEGHRTDKDTLQRFDAHLTAELMSSNILARTEDPTNPGNSYTPGCVGYASSPGVPFRQERVVVHGGINPDYLHLNEAIRNQPFISISIRKGTHDSALVDKVHDAMDKFGFPKTDVARTVTGDRPENGTVTYHFQAE